MLLDDEKTLLPRTDVFKQLAARGVARAVVEFNGGNDEGGVESILLIDATDTVLETWDEHYQESNFDPVTLKYSYRKHPLDIADLIETLCAPVYEEYGSFGGEFYVSGTVTWNVDSNEVVMKGTVETMQGDDFCDVV